MGPAKAARFAKDPAGFEQLARWIGQSAKQALHEDTGPRHREFEGSPAGRPPLARVNALTAPAGPRR